MNLPSLVAAFIEKIQHFEYPVDNLDPTWEVLFKYKKEQWQYLQVLQYRDRFTITCRIGEEGTLRWNPPNTLIINDAYQGEYEYMEAEEELIEEWMLILEAANGWLDFAQKDWITANQKTQEEFPIPYRKGIIAKQLVYQYLPSLFEWRKNLEDRTLQHFLNFTSEGVFANESSGTIEKMSAKKYFDYCKIAYTASALSDDMIDTSLSGREMYSRYADGRHEGLLDIEEQSEQEFSDWFNDRHPKRTKGGHPWEIRRGRILLYVQQSWNKASFNIVLAGGSTEYLVDQLRIYNALRVADLPVSMSNFQEVKNRICLQDDFGILPIFESTSQASHEFENEEVYDGIYYDDLGDYKHQLNPFINWKRLPLLVPKQAALGND